MRVKNAIIFVYLCMFGVLSANEPLLARLENTISNEKQRFGIDNYSFTCTPYGVLALEKLYINSSVNSECRKSIERLYRKNPALQYYTDRILKTQQLYHIEIKNKECIVYAKGEITLSELLLRNGLAIYKPSFRDEEFKSYFSMAQRGAKIAKKGLWKELIFESCIKELNVEN